MANGPSQKQVSVLRWLTMLALISLFVADYGFGLMAKEVPTEVYYILIVIAIGVDLATLRDITVTFLRSWAGASKDDKPE